VTAAVLAAGAAFNLLCTISSATMGHEPLKSSEGLQLEYRVDLAADRFCGGMCSETEPVAKVTETMIYLKMQQEDEKSIGDLLQISRESGRYLWLITAGGIETRMAGECVKTPFTGFPARIF
jgi:hypothetical protein